MPLVSIRLPDEVEAQLSREAEHAQRPKSEIARDAIVDYLQRLERDRFIADIARAARARDGTEVLASAEEALPLDNEALDAVDGIREPTTRYRVGKKRRAVKRTKR